MLNTEKTYYDFSNVLIKPTKSSLDSRSQVDLNISFSNFEQDVFEGWSPVPVMSANMDTITDVEMAWALLERNWIPVLHKYVSKEGIKELFDKIDEHNKVNENKIDYRNLFISRGTTEQDRQKLKERIEAEPRIKSVCIDVANGHRTSIVSYVKELKETVCKDKVLMVGNVGSADMVEDYISAGVDIIKGGIGPGCFHSDVEIITENGLKKISEVKEGEKVLSHKNEYKKVIGTSTYEEKDKLISINGVLSTPSHKYFVINKENRKKILKEEDIENFAYWLEAYKIDKKQHLLVSIKNDK